MKMKQNKNLTKKRHEAKYNDNNEISATDDRKRLVGSDFAKEALVKRRTVADGL